MKATLKLVVSAAFLLFIYSSSFSQQVAKTIPYATPEGVIGFLQFTPPDYGSQKHPLIIFLHGIGERGNGTSQINAVTANAIPRFCAVNGTTMSFTVNGQTSSFVVLSPQLSTQYGSWPPFYVTELIKYAKANLQIDPNRIYVTGLSLGGGGTWRAITDAPNGDYSFDAGIAAAAPVCGTQEETDANVCATIAANHLPVWAFHSMDDGTVGVGATQHAEILLGQCAGINPAAKFTYYQNGGHGGAWVNAYDTGHITTPNLINGSYSYVVANPNLYEWFLSNTRGTTTQPTYTAPVASAGNAQTITLPNNSVTLTGTGNGTGGATISSYSWTKTSGPATGSITTQGAASTTVTGLVQGTYVFTLTVTDNHGLTSNSAVTITVNLGSSGPSAGEQPIGYIRMSSGSYQACSDGATSGRTAIYATGIANGNMLYLDPAHSQLFNGGWNWYSFAPAASAAVTMAFSVYPNGSINLMTYCSGGYPVASAPVTPPVTVPSGNLAGYIKISSGPYQACADASSSSRIAVYGAGIGNGNILYTDAALTQVYNGGWNWYSFTPTLGGSVTQTFAIYPSGGILLLRSCANGGARIASTETTTVEQDIATLKSLKDAADAAAVTVTQSKLKIYPNPVSSSATIEIYSAGNSVKTISLYDSKGGLKAKYTWQTVQGNNMFSLKDVSGLASGLYIVDIRDSKGKSAGSLKFLKIK